MTNAEIRKRHHGAEIKKIEDRYGTIYFRMALSHLLDVGFQHITAENVAETKAKIMADAASRTGPGIPVMTPEFQCQLLDIALELTQYGLWNLLAYVKTDVVVG